jgi:transcription antitermination factor NusG
MSLRVAEKYIILYYFFSACMSEQRLEEVRNLPVIMDLVFSDQAKIAFHDYEMVVLLNKFPSSKMFLTHSALALPENYMGLVPIARNI